MTSLSLGEEMYNNIASECVTKSSRKLLLLDVNFKFYQGSSFKHAKCQGNDF